SVTVLSSRTAVTPLPSDVWPIAITGDAGAPSRRASSPCCATGTFVGTVAEVFGPFAAAALVPESFAGDDSAIVTIGAGVPRFAARLRNAPALRRPAVPTTASATTRAPP